MIQLAIEQKQCINIWFICLSESYFSLQIPTDVVKWAVWAPELGLRGKNKLELLPESRIPQNKQTLGPRARTDIRDWESEERGPETESPQLPLSSRKVKYTELFWS